jgi:hypothetical protein
MQHPDEGTIHAWLDGALSPEEGRAIEEHAAECASCAAAIAEARGLIAGSSRILSALDAVPGGVLPAADTFDALGSEQVKRVRPAWWRSVPLRAAAAIVLVGSVSWLATRSNVQRDVTTASDIAADTFYERDTIAVSTTASVPSIMDRASAGRPSASTQTQKPRGFEAPRPKPVPPAAPSRREEANIVAQSAPAVDAPVAQVGGAMPSAASAGSGSALGAMQQKSTMLDRDSVVARRASDEQRLVTASTAKMRAPMAAMSAPIAARLMPGSDALQRLTGCYSLELAPPSAASLLPARIELREERADTNEPAAMLARPAVGEPPFSRTTRATWKTLGEHAVELTVIDGARSVTTTLTLAGDSVSGWARASENGTQTSVSTVRGERTPCSAP